MAPNKYISQKSVGFIPVAEKANLVRTNKLTGSSASTAQTQTRSGLRQEIVQKAKKEISVTSNMRAKLTGEIVIVPPPPPPPAFATAWMAMRTAHRYGFIPRPGEVAAIQAVGAKNWLKNQLNYSILDFGRPGDFLTTNQIYNEVRYIGNFGGNPGNTEALAYHLDLFRVQLMKYYSQAINTNQPFAFRLMEFFANHFFVNNALKASDGFEIPSHGAALPYMMDHIRPNMFGKFKDMLKSVFWSVQMQRHLDNINNNHRPGEATPNENLARELLQLFTVTPASGYTQQDVVNTAKLISGIQMPAAYSIPAGQNIDEWRHRVVISYYGHRGLEVQPNYGRNFPPLNFAFLNYTVPTYSAPYPFPDNLPAVVRERIDEFLDRLAASEHTARNICTKLFKNFISDYPRPVDIQTLVDAYMASDGDMAHVVRTMIDMPISLAYYNYQAPIYDVKVKLPATYIIGLCRAAGLVGNIDPMQYGIQNQNHPYVAQRSRLRNVIPQPPATIDPAVAEQLALLREIEGGLLQRLNHRFMAAPTVEGYSSASRTWLSGAGIMGMIDTAGMFALRIAPRITAANFTAQTIQADLQQQTTRTMGMVNNPNLDELTKMTGVLASPTMMRS